MKRTRTLPVVLAVATVLLLAALFSLLLPVAAASAEEETILSPDPRAITTLFDTVEDDFNRATVDWEIRNGTAEAVTSLSVPPYSVFEGSRSLRLITNGTDTVTMLRTPTVLTAVDGIAYVAAVLYAPEEAGEASLSLTMECDSGRYAATKTLTAGHWQAVFFDLRDQHLQGAIGSISLTFKADKRGHHAFLLDTLGGTTEENAPFAARHLTTSFRAEGCSFSATESDSVKVTLTGSRQSLEAVRPLLTDFSGGAGLRIRLRNRSTCQALTLQYTTLASPTYTEANSLTVTIPEGNDTVSCLFPLPDSYIGGFRLVFSGVCRGEIEILSIAATPCYATEVSVGKVEECLIGKTKTAFTVKGSFTAEEAKTYAGCSLYLYELMPYESRNDISTARTPVARTYLNGRDFSFTLPLSADGKELARRYAVMIYRDGALIPVGDPAFLTNPELLASHTVGTTPQSQKGARPLSDNYLFDNLSYTAVEIRLDRLVSFGVNTITHTVGEDTVSLDRAYVEALDRQMKDYDACDIRVIFLLRLAFPEDLSLHDLLCHPNAAGGTYAALNTVTAEGIGALRAVCHFLTSRYGMAEGKTDNLIGYTVGSSVNDAAEHYNMGDVTLLTLAEDYGNALRLVYNIARSLVSDMEVYLPLGGDWYRDDPVGQRASFSAYAMLEAVSSSLTTGGDIDWSLSYDIHTDRLRYAWETKSPDLTVEAPFVNAANMEILTDSLAQNRFLYHGVSRSLLLLETEIWDTEDENEKIRLSADYVYTFLKLSSRPFASVKAYIPAHPVHYGNVLSLIDTNHFTDATAFAAEIMGQALFDELVAEASAFSTFYLAEERAVSVIPSAVKGEIALFDFSDHTAGWYPSLYCAGLKGGVSLGERNDLLSARFEAADPNLWRGVAVSLDTPVDLSHAPYLSFVCRPAVLPENVTELELTVVVKAGKHRQTATMTLKAGTDNTVVVDVSAFPHANACDGFAVYLRGIDETDIGEPTLLISSIRAMSEEYAGHELDRVIHPEDATRSLPTVSLRTVITVAVIGVAALLLEVVRMGLRRRQEKQQEET